MKSTRFEIRISKEDKEQIALNAMEVGLSSAEFLRRVGLGYEPTSVTDQKAILTLAKINGDLGRLGGLLKMWLSNDEKVIKPESEKQFVNTYENVTNIVETLKLIRKTQEEILNLVIETRKGLKKGEI